MTYNNSRLPIIEAESYDQRFERLQSTFDHAPKWIKRGEESNRDRRNNVIRITETPEGNYIIKEWSFSHNIITNDGDIFYAKRAAQITPATNEGASRMELANPASQVTPAKTHTYGDMSTPITASRKLFDGGFPTTNDQNSENVGAGVNVVTYRTSWSSGEWNADGIKNGCIHDSESPSSQTKIVALFTLATFDKTANQALKCYLNHEFAGE